MAEASLPELSGDSEATHCPSVVELEELLRAGKISSCNRVDEVWPNLYIGDAQDPGALCGRREPLRHTGPGLPHAAPADVPAPGSDHCETAPMGLPQPRLPPPALPAGPEASGCRPELRSQGCSLLPATGLCHFATAVLALLVLLGAPAQVDTWKMVKAQCGVRPTACYSVRFLWPSALPISRCLQSPQKQHQVCRDKRLEVSSTKCLSEKTTAWTRYPHRYAARDRSRLTQLGITHVVNVAAGKFQVDTGAKFYHGMPVEYYGIEADDNPFFDLSVYFLPVARYIRTALSVPQGRVLVHCAMGVSRSATVVLAFLMIYENMTLVQAIQKVQAHRDICPNSGFLRQLQVLDNRLRRDSVHHNKDRSPSGGLWDGGSLQGWPRCTRRLASSGSVQWQPRDGVCVPVGLPEGGGQVRTN
ncbi:dual specificity protein phosphatase 13A isoform 4-T4 [Molossus nigricans]